MCATITQKKKKEKNARVLFILKIITNKWHFKKAKNDCSDICVSAGNSLLAHKFLIVHHSFAIKLQSSRHQSFFLSLDYSSLKRTVATAVVESFVSSYSIKCLHAATFLCSHKANNCNEKVSIRKILWFLIFQSTKNYGEVFFFFSCVEQTVW